MDTAFTNCVPSAGTPHADCAIVIREVSAGDDITVASCEGTPFSADCIGFGAFDRSARATSYNTCANAVAGDPDTATTDTDCIRVVVAKVDAVIGADPVAEIPAITVADCVADPFRTGCVINGFIGGRDAICESSSDARSFNAGCTVEDYSDIADARAAAIEFCRDENPTHESWL